MMISYETFDASERLTSLLWTGLSDLPALARMLDELPPSGGEASVVIQQARRAMAAVAKGDKRYRPYLRHTLKRLIVLLQKCEIEGV